MPELPEVETIVRSLARRALGQRIRKVGIRSPRILQGGARGIAGQTIRAVNRHGKYIVIELERGLLTIHLRMTGRLLFDADPGPYTRAVFQLDRDRLIFDDVRQFGRIEYYTELPAGLARLGPDALAVALPEFRAMLRARNRQIKALLLDQAFLRGLGNIYTDEALFRARIHPLSIASRVSAPKAARLHAAIVEVLELGIEHGGTSISDYVETGGRRGTFQDLLQAYGRTGEACVNCGRPIRRIVVAQRGTHYCPRCQSL